MDKEKFYDSISQFYNEMIDFDKALIRRKELLAGFLSHDIAKANFYWRRLYAADLGCATGIDSIALSQLGLEVTSFDISGEMIKKAKTNAEKFRIKLNAVKTDLADIAPEFNENFDLIISSSNTPANIPFDKIQLVLDNFYRILKPNGKFIIQLLNYDKMLKEKTQTFARTNIANDEIIRGYTYGEDDMQFNVKRQPRENSKPQENIVSGDSAEHSLQNREDLLSKNNPDSSSENVSEFSSSIFPHRKGEMEQYLLNSGFAELEFFGGLDRNRFNIETSKDLVITGIKPE
ncbi:MAG: class I SAM-dependent methyltransferase [Melioribacteraceae bacterium]